MMRAEETRSSLETTDSFRVFANDHRPARIAILSMLTFGLYDSWIIYNLLGAERGSPARTILKAVKALIAPWGLSESVATVRRQSAPVEEKSRLLDQSAVLLLALTYTICYFSFLFHRDYIWLRSIMFVPLLFLQAETRLRMPKSEDRRDAEAGGFQHEKLIFIPLLAAAWILFGRAFLGILTNPRMLAAFVIAAWLGWGAAQRRFRQGYLLALLSVFYWPVAWVIYYSFRPLRSGESRTGGTSWILAKRVQYVIPLYVLATAIATIPSWILPAPAVFASRLSDQEYIILGAEYVGAVGAERERIHPGIDEKVQAAMTAMYQALEMRAFAEARLPTEMADPSLGQNQWAMYEPQRARQQYASRNATYREEKREYDRLTALSREVEERATETVLKQEPRFKKFSEETAYRMQELAAQIGISNGDDRIIQAIAFVWALFLGLALPAILLALLKRRLYDPAKTERGPTGFFAVGEPT